MSVHTVEPITTQAVPPAASPRSSARPAGLRQAAGLGADADQIKADGLVQPVSVAGLTSTEDPWLPMSERIKADGLVQPVSVAGLTST